ncbi:serine/threonine-protein kinase [Stigmatella sp. ncwal1]|uniref:Serine/threonine-protein kinase n=1 Tax=Stigmatella ashevillensis TaxID=2995309 RepID=A0ABT5DJQ4_9BACT|nr:serine/threonine-protein kinase [Stigmatella ashevillena]MDC0713858.1 serine/threonine-protein kinase [Stigmatella ashevillena]
MNGSARTGTHAPSGWTPWGLQGGSSGSQDLPTLSVGGPSESRPLEKGLFAERYVLRRVIGSGGMGTVYQAWDELCGQSVALKVLEATGPRNPGAQERFRREAKLARRISHPNVARVFELGSAQGRSFLTMEYVEGEDLRTLLAREGSLSAVRAARLAVEVCAGLEAAHHASVAHRDLKPANVLVERGGRVVLTDFGIARALEDSPEEGLTRIHGLVGTPQYMAPEQLTEGKVDGRTDLYAVGLLLYEMLVGQPAFAQSTSLKAAFERMGAPPPDPRDRREVPAELAQVVRGCLAVSPAERPANARAVTRTLEAWLTGERV